MLHGLTGSMETLERREERQRSSLKSLDYQLIKKIISAYYLFSVVNKLLDKKQEVFLPTSKSQKELADFFMQYILENISKIRSKFAGVNQTTEIVERNPSVIKCLSTFECATEDEYRSKRNPH